VRARPFHNPVGPPQGIWAVEQVAERTAIMGVHPAPSTMLRSIMNHVAALAERRHPVECAVARIMIKVGTGQHHRRPGTVRQNILRGPSYAPPLAIAPAEPLPVPPSPVTQMEDFQAVGAAAMLALAPARTKRT